MFDDAHSNIESVPGSCPTHKLKEQFIQASKHDYVHIPNDTIEET